MNIKSNQLNCLPGKFLSGVYRLLNKIREKSLFIQTLSKEDPGQRPAGMTSSFGFTLIELLVVVLIIGILSAIALPQYQVAVNKARLAGVLPIMQAIKQANQVYFLENGKYTNNPEELGISLPAGYALSGTDESNPRVLSLSNGNFYEIVKTAGGSFDHPRILSSCSKCAGALWVALDTNLWRCYPSGTDQGVRVCKTYGASASCLEACKSTGCGCEFSF